MRGLQTDASASGLGAWDVLDVVWEVPDGALWEIAVADGNCSGIAAQTNEAGIGSSKTMAAVPTISAGALRYMEFAAVAGGGAAAASAEFVVSGRGSISTTEIGLGKLMCLGGCCDRTSIGLARRQAM